MFNRFVIYFVKRYWFFVALGAAVVIVFFLWLTRPRPAVPTPTPTPLPTLVPLGGEKITGIFRLDPALVLPATQASLYRVEKASISPTKAIAIARALGFTDNPSVTQDVLRGEHYNWSQPGQSLVVGLEVARVAYSRELFVTPPPRIGPLPSPEEAQKALLDSLERAGLLPENITLEPQLVDYLAFDGVQFIDASAEKATFIQVSFLPKINEGLITLTASSLAPVRGMVTYGGIVHNFEFELPFANLEAEAMIRLKERSQIQLSLFLEGRVVSLEGTYEQFDLAGLKEAVLTRAELVYPVSSPPQDVLSPVFLLTGTATTRDGESRQIEVYLPAVAP